MAPIAPVDGAIGPMPVAAQQSAADATALPNAAGSLKFAVLDDSGTGEREPARGESGSR